MLKKIYFKTNKLPELYYMGEASGFSQVIKRGRHKYTKERVEDKLGGCYQLASGGGVGSLLFVNTPNTVAKPLPDINKGQLEPVYIKGDLVAVVHGETNFDTGRVYQKLVLYAEDVVTNKEGM